MLRAVMVRLLHQKQGFSLVEMSIVLAIISVILAGILPYIVESRKTQDSDETMKRIEAVEEALLVFYAANGSQMPCPADATLAVNSANFGVEADVDGTCTGGAIEANFEDVGNGVVGGGIPTKTLNLPDEYAFDGWGRRLSYHVTTAATNATTTGTIIVQDHAAANRTTEGFYVVMSHGPTGHGGYSVSGARYSANITNASELENCDCDATAAATAYDNEFVMGMEFPSSNPAVLFDDIVRYRTESQVQQSAYVNAADITINVCPAGFTLIGTAGTLNAFCIHTDEQVPVGLYNANAACAALGTIRGDGHLCTLHEWHAACIDGTPNDMTDNREWIAQVTDTQGIAVGNGSCTTFEDRVISSGNRYRCCLR